MSVVVTACAVGSCEKTKELGRFGSLGPGNVQKSIETEMALV